MQALERADKPKRSSKNLEKSFEKSLTNHGECVKIAELLERANKTEAKFEKLRKKFKKRLDKRNQM